jgi:hypothetical protein
MSAALTTGRFTTEPASPPSRPLDLRAARHGGDPARPSGHVRMLGTLGYGPPRRPVRDVPGLNDR